MNNKFKKRVLQPTIKEAKKYHIKNGKVPDENILNELKIQVMLPFLRILSATFGLFLLFVSFFAFQNSSLSFGLVAFVSGIILCLIGFYGRKKKLQSVLEKSYNYSDISLIIEALINSFGRP